MFFWMLSLLQCVCVCVCVCVLEECQRLTFGWGYSEMFKSVCVCVCHIDIWTSMSAVLAGV